MRQGKFYQISKEEYKKAMEQGVMSIIGAHIHHVISADVEQAEDGTCWLSIIQEWNEDGK